MSDFLSLLSALTGGYMRGNQMLQNRKIKEAQIARENARDAALATDREEDRKLRAKQIGISERQLNETLREGKETTLKGRASNFTSSWDKAFKPIETFNEALTNHKFSSLEEATKARDAIRKDLLSNIVGLGNMYNTDNLAEFYQRQPFFSYLSANARGLQDFIPTNIENIFDSLGNVDPSGKPISIDPTYSGGGLVYNPSKPPDTSDIKDADRFNFDVLKEAGRYQSGSVAQQQYLGLHAPQIIARYAALGLKPPPWTTKITIPGFKPDVQIRAARTPLPKGVSPLTASDQARELAGYPTSAEMQPREAYIGIPTDPVYQSLVQARQASTARTLQIINFQKQMDPLRIANKRIENSLRGQQASMYEAIQRSRMDLNKALTVKAQVEADLAAPNYYARKQQADAATADAYNDLLNNADRSFASATAALAEWDKNNTAPLATKQPAVKTKAQTIANILDQDKQSSNDTKFLSDNAQFIRENGELIKGYRERNALIRTRDAFNIIRANAKRSQENYFKTFMPYPTNPYGGIPSGMMGGSNNLPIPEYPMPVPPFLYSPSDPYGAGTLGGSPITDPFGQ